MFNFQNEKTHRCKYNIELTKLIVISHKKLVSNTNVEKKVKLWKRKTFR